MNLQPKQKIAGGEAGKKRRVPWVALGAILALVAIVAAVLIPSYADYADRAQVAEAFSLLGAAKRPLAEHYKERKKWPSLLGEVAGTLSGRYVQSIAITKGAGAATGEIELTALMRIEGVDRRVAGKSVKLSSSDGGKTWRCGAHTVSESTLPLSCREQR